MRFIKVILVASFLAVVVALAPSSLQAERLKDVSDILGARPNQLIGYGLVVGLNGSGDGPKAEFTLQSVAAMLRRLGVRIDPRRIKLKNVAAVIVTAEISAFSRAGQRMEVLVSSLGDAKSLRGGTLVQTPMRGADRHIYAVAQGPISVGGFSAKGGGGASKVQNHPTVGRIPGGALIEREIPTSVSDGSQIKFALHRPSSTIATRAVEKINEILEGPFAAATDPGLITLSIPEPYAERIVELLSLVGDVDIEQEGLAKIVINERTGTVVVGSKVRLHPAAIAHGGLTVEITREVNVNQPNTPFTGGNTVVTDETNVEAELLPGDLHMISATSTVGDLVNALNTLGVKPSDMIIIFQSLKAAGAIFAEIEVQ